MSKVSIITDFLFERSDELNQLEIIVSLFPDAQIYTLAHQPGKIWGGIEERRIHSTFLNNLIKKNSDIEKWAFLIPSALKDLSNRVNSEFVFVYTRGWTSQVQFKKEKSTFIYHYDHESINDKDMNRFLFRVFKSYLGNWQSKETLYPSAQYTPNTPQKAGKVLNRVFLSKDYPFIADEDLWSQQNSIIVLAGDHNDHSVIKEFCDNKGLKLRIYSPGYQGEIGEIIHSDCSGVFSQILSQSLAIISFEKNEFSPMELGAQCMGIPIIKKTKTHYDSLEGIYYFEKDSDSITSYLDSIFKSEELIDRQKMRRNSLKFGGRQFKNDFIQILSDEFTQEKVRSWMK